MQYVAAGVESVAHRHKFVYVWGNTGRGYFYLNLFHGSSEQIFSNIYLTIEMS